MRELDYHDTYLAADYSHPGDNTPPLLAVAQHVGASGHDLVRAIATGYEVQIDLVRSISLHRHKIDHVAHLGRSVAAGLGTLLGLPTEVVYHAVGQALRTTTSTRQSRKGQISSWKAFAPALAGKLAIEAVDRAMRGEGSPAPIYEGEDGVIAWLLDGPEARYAVPLPERGEAKTAILRSYTKEHSAEYQAQAWIDLARRLRTSHPAVADPDHVESIVIHTSHHTHFVIGSAPAIPRSSTHRPAERPSTTHCRTSSASPSRTARGTTSTPMCGRATRGDTVALWQRCPPRRTRSGPRGTTRMATASPTADGSSSPCAVASRSSTRSTWPTPTRAGRDRSGGTSTSRSSACSPNRPSASTSATGSSISPSGCRS